MGQPTEAGSDNDGSQLGSRVMLHSASDSCTCVQTCARQHGAAGVVRQPCRLVQWPGVMFGRDDLDRDGRLYTHVVEETNQTNEIKGAFAREASMQGTFPRLAARVRLSVVELHREDALGRHRAQPCGVRAATKIVPRVDENAAIAAPG